VRTTDLPNVAESGTHSYHYPFEWFRNEKKTASVNEKFMNKFDVWP
jgi:hypothetical protein